LFLVVIGTDFHTYFLNCFFYSYGFANVYVWEFVLQNVDDQQFFVQIQEVVSLHEIINETELFFVQQLDADGFVDFEHSLQWFVELLNYAFAVQLQVVPLDDDVVAENQIRVECDALVVFPQTVDEWNDDGIIETVLKRVLEQHSLQSVKHLEQLRLTVVILKQSI